MSWNVDKQELRDMLELVPDLGEVERALVREHAIRAAMARTGEGRTIVAEGIDALQSMDREAVLNLTEGNPTTLPDALARYTRIVETWDELVPRDRVVGDLDAILENPWPAEEERLASHGINQSVDLHVGNAGSSAVVLMGGPSRWEIYRTETYGNQAVVDAVEGAAHAVHRAVLTRVIADRDHHVKLSGKDTTDLYHWLERQTGSWRPSDPSRVTIDATGGGIMIRTRPYAYQHRVAQAQADQQRYDVASTEARAGRRGLLDSGPHAREHSRSLGEEQVLRALDNS